MPLLRGFTLFKGLSVIECRDALSTGGEWPMALSRRQRRRVTKGPAKGRSARRPTCRSRAFGPDSPDVPRTPTVQGFLRCPRDPGGFRSAVTVKERRGEVERASQSVRERRGRESREREGRRGWGTPLTALQSSLRWFEVTCHRAPAGRLGPTRRPLGPRSCRGPARGPPRSSPLLFAPSPPFVYGRPASQPSASALSLSSPLDRPVNPRLAPRPRAWGWHLSSWSSLLPYLLFFFVRRGWAVGII